MMTAATNVDHRRRARWLVPFVAILAVTGCATIHRSEAGRTEQLLAAAGFKMQSADTPEQAADLKSLPARKLVPQNKDGNVVYTYADPDKCHCLYVGGPTEYSTYERLRVEREIAVDNAEAAMDWPWWGPWRW
jgi:hypothetical protein